MKKVLSLLRRADQDFQMIKAGDRVMVGVSGGKDSLLLITALAEYRRFSDHPFELCGGMIDLGFGDRVMVGVSGGKDSLLLLTALAEYRRFSDHPFELCGGMIDLGFGDLNPEPILKYCEAIGVPLYIKHSNIGHVIFETRKETNPCSLCAKMRRGSLNELAKLYGCNKIALGHHRDDLIETLLMSMLYESRLRVFAPVTWMDRTDMVQIRPLVYLEESHIINAGRRLNLPVARNACPACGHTKRQEMKELVKHLKGLCPEADIHLFRAIQNTQNYDLWDNIKRRPE